MRIRLVKENLTERLLKSMFVVYYHLRCMNFNDCRRILEEIFKEEGVRYRYVSSPESLLFINARGLYNPPKPLQVIELESEMGSAFYVIQADKILELNEKPLLFRVSKAEGMEFLFELLSRGVLSKVKRRYGGEFDFIISVLVSAIVSAFFGYGYLGMLLVFTAVYAVSFLIRYPLSKGSLKGVSVVRGGLKPLKKAGIDIKKVDFPEKSIPAWVPSKRSWSEKSEW